MIPSTNDVSEVPSGASLRVYPLLLRAGSRGRPSKGPRLSRGAPPGRGSLRGSGSPGSIAPVPKATHHQKVRCLCGEEFGFDVVEDGFEPVRKGDVKCPACGNETGHQSLSIEEA